MGCLTMPKGVQTKRYAPEFKKLVVETMQKENLSDCGTARLLTERKKAGRREYCKAPPELLRRGFAFDHLKCLRQMWNTKC